MWSLMRHRVSSCCSSWPRFRLCRPGLPRTPRVPPASASQCHHARLLPPQTVSAVPPASAARQLSQEATCRQLKHHYRSQPPSPKLLPFRDRIAPVTPTRPRHHCRTAAHRGPRGWARPCDKPPARRSCRLPAPPQACRLQTAATPGSYQPPDSGIGACGEPTEAPAHSPPAEQARFRRTSRERARKTRGRGVGGARRGGVGLPPFWRRGPRPGTREVWRPGLGQGQVESPLLFFPGIAAKARAAA